MSEEPIFLILYNVRSVQNVGSMFRTADAAGVSKIYCAGYTPTPLDRFGRKRCDFAKTALGAEKTVPWEHHHSISELISELQGSGVAVIGVEQDKGATHYVHYQYKAPLALLLGPEVEGIERDVLDQCDGIIELSMRGAKESLNVAVACGIALYHVRDVALASGEGLESA